MKKLFALALAIALFHGMEAVAQDVKSYKEGPVTEITYIKVKPGRYDEYMKYLGSTYKVLMEAKKAAGLIVEYNVYSARARTPREPDIFLTVTYANMGAMDRIEEDDAVTAKVMGNFAAQSKSTIDRDGLREILGSEVIQKLVFK